MRGSGSESNSRGLDTLRGLRGFSSCPGVTDPQITSDLPQPLSLQNGAVTG